MKLWLFVFSPFFPRSHPRDSKTTVVKKMWGKYKYFSVVLKELFAKLRNEADFSFFPLSLSKPPIWQDLRGMFFRAALPRTCARFWFFFCASTSACPAAEPSSSIHFAAPSCSLARRRLCFKRSHSAKRMSFYKKCQRDSGGCRIHEVAVCYN